MRGLFSGRFKDKKKGSEMKMKPDRRQLKVHDALRLSASQPSGGELNMQAAEGDFSVMTCKK